VRESSHQCPTGISFSRIADSVYPSLIHFSAAGLAKEMGVLSLADFAEFCEQLVERVSIKKIRTPNFNNSFLASIMVVS
jgi:hypothetical protein